MGPFLKIIHQSSLLANYNKIDKINSPYRKLAIKRRNVKRFLSHTRSIKSENFYSFITNQSVRL